MLPRRLKNFNCFVEGRSMLGLAEEVKLPDLERKLEDYRAGGMNAPIKTDFGHNALEMEITSAEFDTALMTTWGVADPAGVGLRFRAALEREGSDASVQGWEIVARGRLAKVELGSAKSGDAHTVKYALALSYLKITDNGDELLEIDIINLVERVGGVDRLAEQRSALGL